MCSEDLDHCSQLIVSLFECVLEFCLQRQPEDFGGDQLACIAKINQIYLFKCGLVTIIDKQNAHQTRGLCVRQKNFKPYCNECLYTFPPGEMAGEFTARIIQIVDKKHGFTARDRLEDAT